MNIIVFTKKLIAYEPFFKALSNQNHNLKFIYPDSHPHKRESHYSHFVSDCRRFKPELIISFYYNRIIPNDILSIPTLAVNFHGAILPNYAGSHAINWQIINGERQSGVTIHELTKDIDGGRIIKQNKFEISRCDTAREVLQKGVSQSAHLLYEFLEDYKNNTLVFKEQIKSGEEFQCVKRKPEDGEITKDMTDEQAYNMIRALVHPWPGVYYFNQDNQKIIIKDYLSLEQVRGLLRQ